MPCRPMPLLTVAPMRRQGRFGVPCCRYLSFMVKRGPISCRLRGTFILHVSYHLSSYTTRYPYMFAYILSSIILHVCQSPIILHVYVQCRKPHTRLIGAGSGRVYDSPRLAQFVSVRASRSVSRCSEPLGNNVTCRFSSSANKSWTGPD